MHPDVTLSPSLFPEDRGASPRKLDAGLGRTSSRLALIATLTLQLALGAAICKTCIPCMSEWVHMYTGHDT
ncbi:hypothetical protein FKP32DRAFT_1593516 [Trametes sanguinea]|nr:hypothetical protein FKP32DRAFT_1593516 [Trametes sanguinea]